MKLKKYKHGGSSKEQSNSYLKGGQVKLDKNNDGELTEEDFKLLRKQKTSMKTKKKSLYAEYGALVKAMKRYENGGETDPPEKNGKKDPVKDGGVLPTKTVFEDKSGKKQGLLTTYQWKGNSLNKSIAKIDKLIDYNSKDLLRKLGSQEAVDEFRADAHSALARGAFQTVQRMFQDKNFRTPAGRDAEGRTGLGTEGRFGTQDMMSLRLDQGLVKVEPHLVTGTEPARQVTAEEMKYIEQTRQKSGDPAQGRIEKSSMVLLPDGTKGSKFSDEMLSQFAELGAYRDPNAPKPKKEFKPSPEYNAGVKAYQADLQAANETARNVLREYNELGRLGKNSKKGQALKAELDAIRNDRKKLRRLGSDLSDSKGFENYESQRNEIEFEYASEFFD